MRLYRAFFAREPDLEGVKYWIGQFDDGSDLDDLAYSFSQSDEFRATYGDTTDADFVRIVYHNVLGRQPDQAGYGYWLNLVTSGSNTRHGVVRWIVANDEFVLRHPYMPLERPEPEPFDYMCTYTPSPLIPEYVREYPADRFTIDVVLEVDSPIAQSSCNGFVRNGQIIVIGGGEDVVLEQVTTGSPSFTFTLSLPASALDDDGAIDLAVVLEPTGQEPIVYSDHLTVPVRYSIREPVEAQAPLEVRSGIQHWTLLAFRTYDFANQPREIRVIKGQYSPGCEIVGEADVDGVVTFSDLPNTPEFRLPVEISNAGGPCRLRAEFGDTWETFDIETITLLPEDLTIYYAEGCTTPPNCRIDATGFAAHVATQSNSKMIIQTLDGSESWVTPLRTVAYPETNYLVFMGSHGALDGFCIWFEFRAPWAESVASEPRCWDRVPGVMEFVER